MLKTSHALASIVLLAWGCASAPPSPAPAAIDAALAPEPPSTPVAYVNDLDRYAQLRVRITYGGGAATSLNGCPTNGYGVENWQDALKGDRLVTAGFTVKGPDGQTVTLEPVAIRTKKKWLGFGYECTTALIEREYRSPLYSLAAWSSGNFELRTTTHVREKPTAETTDIIARVTAAALSASGTTAPLALPVSAQIRVLAEDAGPNLSSTAGTDIYLDQPTMPAPYTGSLTIGGRVVPVTIEARLLNRASLFSSEAVLAPSAFSTLSADRILQTPIVPAPQGVPRQTVEAYVAARQSAAYNAVRNATTIDALSGGCENLEQTLAEAGMSPVDQALSLWAVVNRNSRLPQIDRDQARCLKSRSGLLQKAGVTLQDSGPPIDETKPASRAEMLVTVAPHGGERDNLTDFFKTTDRRLAAARMLFGYPVAVLDPDSVLTTAGHAEMANAESWLVYGSAPTQPFLTNFGCYAYPADDGLWRARARAERQDGETRDYDIVMQFYKAPADSARIRAVEINPRTESREDWMNCRSAR